MNDEHLMKTYNRLPVSFERGEGCYLYDEQGKQYIDALCGISVTSLGHSHPAFVQAITEQSKKLVHTSNLYHIAAQEKLADKLCAAANMDRVFFGNSGAEANEAAIKLARLHAHNSGNHNPVILTFSGSFHGRTLATLSATAGTAIKEGFAPIVEGFIHLPFNDLAAAEACFQSNPDIAAVLVEPVQGEGGINIAEPAFLKGLQSLCHANNALFMLDEIQSGNGRCGRYFACQLFDKTDNALSPDVITTAKGLGNGIPVGACLAKGKAAETLAAGKHGSTFGGNPLACHVATAVVDTIINENLPERAISLGNLISNLVRSKLGNHEMVTEIRHCGLMIGIELDTPCKEIMQMGLDNGIILNVTSDRVVRLLPPLTLSDQEATVIAEKTISTILEFIDQKNG